MQVKYIKSHAKNSNLSLADERKGQGVEEEGGGTDTEPRESRQSHVILGSHRSHRTGAGQSLVGLTLR